MALNALVDSFCHSQKKYVTERVKRYSLTDASSATSMTVLCCFCATFNDSQLAVAVRRQSQTRWLLWRWRTQTATLLILVDTRLINVCLLFAICFTSLFRVSTGPGNTANLVEFDIFPGNSGNLLKLIGPPGKLRNVGGKAVIDAVLVSCLDGTVMSVGRSSSSHAQLEIVHTLLVVVVLLVEL